MISFCLFQSVAKIPDVAGTLGSAGFAGTVPSTNFMRIKTFNVEYCVVAFAAVATMARLRSARTRGLCRQCAEWTVLCDVSSPGCSARGLVFALAAFDPQDSQLRSLKWLRQSTVLTVEDVSREALLS